MTYSAELWVGGFELALIASGLILLWRFVFSPSARAQPEPPALTGWDVPFTDFLLFIVCILFGAFLLSAGAGIAAKPLGFRGDAATALMGAAAQLGMLGGALLAPVRLGKIAAGKNLTTVLASGVGVFLAALPILLATAFISDQLVRAFGLPTVRQDLIGMFKRAESPWLLITMIILAVIVAPATEELVFRAGIFRYLRTRIPRWLAITLPAVGFAALHVNWKTLAGIASLPPLAVLAILFSLAYERTGHIGTPIVAHALFNLNTLIAIFSGVVKEP